MKCPPLLMMLVRRTDWSVSSVASSSSGYRWAVVAVTTCVASAPAQVWLFPRGQADGNSGCSSISADGLKALAYGYRAAPSFRVYSSIFEPPNGRVDISLTFSTPVDVRGLGLSGDGRTAVGAGYYVNELGPAVPVRMFDTGGVQVMAIPAQHDRAAALATDFTGQRSVGFAQREAGNHDATAVWWSASGEVNQIPLPFTSFYSKAWAVSGDGRTIAGSAVNLFGGVDAFVWREGVGTIILPSATPQFPHLAAFALGISRDGRHIAGYADDPIFARGHFALWTDGVLELIPNPTNGDYFSAYANDVNANGTVMVGTGYVQDYVHRALIWTRDTGNMQLSEYLALRGVPIPPEVVRLTHATGVSDDGLTICGTAILTDGSSRGFVARVPGPGVLGAFIACGMLASRRRRA